MKKFDLDEIANVLNSKCKSGYGKNEEEQKKIMNDVQETMHKFLGDGVEFIASRHLINSGFTEDKQFEDYKCDEIFFENCGGSIHILYYSIDDRIEQMLYSNINEFLNPLIKNISNDIKNIINEEIKKIKTEIND